MNDRVCNRLDVRDFEKRLGFGQREPLSNFRLYQEREQR